MHFFQIYSTFSGSIRSEYLSHLIYPWGNLNSVYRQSLDMQIGEIFQPMSRFLSVRESS